MSVSEFEKAPQPLGALPRRAGHACQVARFLASSRPFRGSASDPWELGILTWGGKTIPQRLRSSRTQRSRSCNVFDGVPESLCCRASLGACQPAAGGRPRAREPAGHTCTTCTFRVSTKENSPNMAPQGHSKSIHKGGNIGKCRSTLLCQDIGVEATREQS